MCMQMIADAGMSRYADKQLPTAPRPSQQDSSWLGRHVAPSTPAVVLYGHEVMKERMLLVAMPGAPSSVLAPSSKAKSP